MEILSNLHRALDSVKSTPAARGTALCLISSAALIGGWRAVERLQSQRRLKNAADSEPSLLAKHSTYESFTTPSGHTYPKIRVFFKPHLNAEKLPKNIPMLVFTHGLGGNASQFTRILTSLITLAPCLAIDLPGCGRSEFAPAVSSAYTTHALAELVATVIGQYQNDESQEIVLVGHSLGCSINTLLGSSTSPLFHLLHPRIISMIAICPRGDSLTPNEIATIRRLTWLPSPLFDLLRLIDRRGGIASRSVTRIVGETADEETRKLQLKYNLQSESATFLRIVAASLGPEGMPGRDIWSGVKVPLFLVGGDSDHITPAREVDKIASWLTKSPILTGKPPPSDQPKFPTLPTTAGDTTTAQKALKPTLPNPDPPRTNSGTVIQDELITTKHAFALKATKFPAPAAHGLLYAADTVRILSGMIEGFLAHHVDERLGAGWQLQHLTTSGKWDVKNLKKWQAVQACSEPIGGIFRAMKTMREVDDEHSPKEFVKRYSADVLPDGVAVVIDISHETPVYHPQGLEDAGVKYVKFPTVSKEVPTAEEVDGLIKLIDELRADEKLMAPRCAGPDGKMGALKPTIGIHCHYGYNRTGAIVICYLVEKEGYRLQDALQEFAEKKPPGVKHDHFINELYVRYAVKMERRGTIVG